ncbi:MAG: hypothetical protein KGI54_13665 [Pseudomonadota bacterium]|nr:hypothetical protein [Pseudomonadota bacterium]
MNGLINAIHMQAQLAQAGTASMQLGTISSYDPGSYCAKVLLQPSGTETGWLPVSSAIIGNGWGLFCPPTIGDMVKVHFQEGDINAGVIGSRLFNDSDRPLPCPVGEMWLVHQSGAYIKLLNTGHISLHSTAEIDAGNLGNTLHTLVHDAFMSLFNNHTHGGGAIPTQQMTTAHLTTVLKAN